jgi:hypothetical protein
MDSLLVSSSLGFPKGGRVLGTRYRDSDTQDAETEYMDIIRRTMVALDGMTKKRYKIYADEYM